MKLLAITVYVAVFVVLSVPSETAKLKPVLNFDPCNQDLVTVRAAKFAALEIQLPLGPQKWILTTKCKQALQFGYEPGFVSTISQEFPKYTLKFRRKSPLSWVDYESCNAVVEYYRSEFVLKSGSCNI